MIRRVFNSYHRPVVTMLFSLLVSFTDPIGNKHLTTSVRSRSSKPCMSSKMVHWRMLSLRPCKRHASRSTRFRTKIDLNRWNLTKLRVSKWTEKKLSSLWVNWSTRVTSRHKFVHKLTPFCSMDKVTWRSASFHITTEARSSSFSRNTWRTSRPWLMRTTDSWTCSWTRVTINSSPLAMTEAEDEMQKQNYEAESATLQFHTPLI